jgi:hypothetical protein
MRFEKSYFQPRVHCINYWSVCLLRFTAERKREKKAWPKASTWLPHWRCSLLSNDTWKPSRALTAAWRYVYELVGAQAVEECAVLYTLHLKAYMAYTIMISLVSLASCLRWASKSCWNILCLQTDIGYRVSWMSAEVCCYTHDTYCKLQTPDAFWFLWIGIA